MCYNGIVRDYTESYSSIFRDPPSWCGGVKNISILLLQGAFFIEFFKKEAVILGRKQDENLIPNAARTPSELREITRKGGIASGKARREKKKLKDILEKLLNEKVMIDGEKKTGAEAITFAMIKKASTGDVSAFLAIRDTIGEKPTEKQEIDSTVKVVMDKKTEDFSG